MKNRALREDEIGSSAYSLEAPEFVDLVSKWNASLVCVEAQESLAPELHNYL